MATIKRNKKLIVMIIKDTINEGFCLSFGRRKVIIITTEQTNSKVFSSEVLNGLFKK
jgi:hypothetical protein